MRIGNKEPSPLKMAFSRELHWLLWLCGNKNDNSNSIICQGEIPKNGAEGIALTDVQVADLARPLVEIVTKFYEDPENEKGFQTWLQQREKATAETS